MAHWSVLMSFRSESSVWNNLSKSARWYLLKSSVLAPWDWWPDVVLFVHKRMMQDGGHDWGHLWRVYSNAHRIFEGEVQVQSEDGDELWTIIATAALCHDVINLPKDDLCRAQASTLAAQEAAGFMVTCSDWWTLERLMRLADAIRCHSYSSGFVATSLEAKILSDADRLDALGAVGVARTFAVGGALGRPIATDVDPLAKARVPDDTSSSLDHFFCKLFTLRERMYTDTGRAIADTRLEFMHGFVHVLGHELEGQASRDDLMSNQ